MCKLLTICSIVFLATACTTTPEECDPSVDPGFFNKIGCTVSGSYEARIQQKEQQLSNLQSQNKYLNEILTQLQDRETLVYGTINERQALLDNIEVNLNDLENDLKAKNKLNSDLKKQIAKAKSSIQQASDPAIATEYSKRQAYLNQLQQEVAQTNELLAQYNAL